MRKVFGSAFASSVNSIFITYKLTEQPKYQLLVCTYNRLSIFYRQAGQKRAEDFPAARTSFFIANVPPLS